jgi:N-acetylglucosamine-6-phosphate deacetylase
MLFQNARILLPDRIQPGALRIVDGRISALGPVIATPNEEVVDLGGRYLAPGFIDLHIHGAVRRDTMEATPEAFDIITKHHARGGTTSLALTTVVATSEDIVRVLDAVEAYRQQEPVGARVLGVHIEGPYFSPSKPGAHWPQLIRNPDPDEYLAWIDRTSLITQMTVAPELPGALPLITALSERGIIASGGHSDAWDEDAAAGFAHGMHQVTHTYNCMSSQRRRGPYRVAGLLEFAMSEPEIACELIADGHHVSPTLIRALYQAKGPDGIILVTDAAGGAGLEEGEQYTLGTLPAVVRNDVGITADGVALASSTCGMIDCVRNMVTLGGVSMVEAVRMATLSPAAALGIESKKGVLRPGADADLVIFDDQFAIQQTIVGGRRVDLGIAESSDSR